MSFTFRAQTSQGNASGGALTVNKPAGTVNGDLIVVVAYLENNANVWDSVGAGFNQVAQNPVITGEATVKMWWKWASGEPASWTWTPHTSAWRIVVVASYSGGSGSGAAVDVSSSNSGLAQSAPNQTAPSVLTTATNDLLVFGFGDFQGNEVTAPSGAATNLRISLGGCAICDANIATATNTGTTTANIGASLDFAAIHGAFFLSPGGAAALVDHPLFVGKPSLVRASAW